LRIKYVTVRPTHTCQRDGGADPTTPRKSFVRTWYGACSMGAQGGIAMNRLALLVPVALVLATAACEPAPPPPACADNYKALGKMSGDHRCSCAANVRPGFVWGSNVYTTDSAICGAAVHAGAIDAKA